MQSSGTTYSIISESETAYIIDFSVFGLTFGAHTDSSGVIHPGRYLTSTSNPYELPDSFLNKNGIVKFIDIGGNTGDVSFYSQGYTLTNIDSQGNGFLSGITINKQSSHNYQLFYKSPLTIKIEQMTA